MVVRGRVRDGVVVLENAQLPEGQEVIVLVAQAGAVDAEGSSSHSILDIPPVSLGRILRPLTAEDDLLGEMLEGRS